MALRSIKGECSITSERNSIMNRATGDDEKSDRIELERSFAAAARRTHCSREDASRFAHRVKRRNRGCHPFKNRPTRALECRCKSTKALSADERISFRAKGVPFQFSFFPYTNRLLNARSDILFCFLLQCPNDNRISNLSRRPFPPPPPSFPDAAGYRPHQLI